MITKTVFTAAIIFLMTFSAFSQDIKQHKGQTSISDDELKVFLSIMSEITDQEKVKQNIEDYGEDILRIIKQNPYIDRQKYMEINKSGIEKSDDESQLSDKEKQAFQEVEQQIIDLVLDRAIDKYPMTKQRFEEIKVNILELNELQKRYKSMMEKTSK